VHVRRTSSTGTIPEDPLGEVVARQLVDLLGRADVELRYDPVDDPPPPPPPPVPGVLAAAAAVLPGWTTTLTVTLDPRVAGLVAAGRSGAPEPLAALPAAALRAIGHLAPTVRPGRLSPALRRALRDTVVVEFLGHHRTAGAPPDGPPWLLAETLEYLIELSGTRVESQSPTHGVVITDALRDTPRLSVPYPAGLRGATRGPLLFDGQRAVLIVDEEGRARTELQWHRLERLASPAPLGVRPDHFVDSGSLVALATRRLGGIGFFLREDRSIWTFVDGRPLVIRRGEHWTAFPLSLAAALGDAIGGGHAVDLVVQAALMIATGRSGAIFGIVDADADLEGTVEPKDRFDLRNRVDPLAMRPETRLHHLIDVDDLDAPTLARLAGLDGATVVDRDGRLLAYGAIVSSTASEHEGARTAAARTLSTRALAVLKVSEDGEITVLRDGQVVASLLRAGPGATIARPAGAPEDDG
jgi:hypothetical protein